MTWGTYRGLSAQFSGDGFSDMTFEVAAQSRQDFEQWVDATRTGGGTLDAAILLRRSCIRAPTIRSVRRDGGAPASSMLIPHSSGRRTDRRADRTQRIR